MTRRNAQGSGSHSPSPWRLDEHPYFLPGDNRAVPPATRADFGHLDHRTQVLACVELVKREGLDFLVLGGFKWSSQHGLCELFGGTGPEPRPVFSSPGSFAVCC